MSEQLAQLEKKGGSGSITLECVASGSNSGEQYGGSIIRASHPFHKLKVISYVNIGSSHSNYPVVKIDGVSYNRPTIGTEYDVTNKGIDIVSYSANSSYAKVGIIVELS